MVNNWQDAVRHCIRVNNIGIERFTRKIAEIEDRKELRDLVRLEILKARLREREMANEDLEWILEDYKEED